ncbi:putative MFS-type transporter C09D4.1 [Styela clava]
MPGINGLPPSSLKLYPIRWMVVFAVIVYGCQVGIISVTWGIWHQFLVDHFHITEIEADNVNLSAALGSILAAIPVLFIAQMYVHLIKPWLQFGLALMGLSLFIEALVIALKQHILLMMLGQFIGGFAQVVFFVLVPLLATVWFDEREQATVLGISFFAFCFGKLIGTALPTFINLENIQGPILHSQSHALVSTLSIISCLDVILLLIITAFLPNLPVLPPSRAEAQRLKLIKEYPTGLRHIWRNLLSEFKVLFFDKTSAILIFVQTTLITMSIVQFILMPVPEIFLNKTSNTSSNVTSTTDNDLLTLPKSQVLVVFSIGGLIGSISAGLATDKFKKYNPIAQILCLGILICGVLITIGIEFDIFLLQICSSGMYGVFSLGANAFFVEILKQYVYPKVKEIVFGMALSFFIGIWLLIYVPILRQIELHFGSLGFLISFCLIFLICEILASIIKPELKRFNYDSEQLALIRDESISTNVR